MPSKQDEAAKKTVLAAQKKSLLAYLKDKKAGKKDCQAYEVCETGFPGALSCLMRPGDSCPICVRKYSAGNFGFVFVFEN